MSQSSSGNTPQLARDYGTTGYHLKNKQLLRNAIRCTYKRSIKSFKTRTKSSPKLISDNIP